MVIVTEWEQFRALDLTRLKAVMAAPVLIDLKNVYQPEELSRAGFRFEGIGRPDIRDPGQPGALTSQGDEAAGVLSPSLAAE